MGAPIRYSHYTNFLDLMLAQLRENNGNFEKILPTIWLNGENKQNRQVGGDESVCLDRVGMGIAYTSNSAGGSSTLFSMSALCFDFVCFTGRKPSSSNSTVANCFGDAMLKGCPASS